MKQNSTRTIINPAVAVPTALLVGALLLSACGPQAAPPVPTRAPAPTFTASPEVVQVQADPNAAEATSAAQEQPAPADTDPPAEEQPAEPTTPPQEEPTPEPQTAEAVVAQPVNIRSGPGLTHNVLGAANPGDRFVITGKNQAGDWWEINYNGQTAWVFAQLVTTENAQSVALAVVIPTAPPPPPTPIPPTPVPAPAEPTQPPAPPAPTYKFNVAVVSRCDPQEAGTWFEGKTYIGGSPQSGYDVTFSYAPDGPPVATIQSGPHDGYSNWDAGYYSHIISSPGNGPREGNWFVWIVENGQRISEIANFQTGGSGGGCNQAVVDFDSR